MYKKIYFLISWPCDIHLHAVYAYMSILMIFMILHCSGESAAISSFFCPVMKVISYYTGEKPASNRDTYGEIILLPDFFAKYIHQFLLALGFLAINTSCCHSVAK